MGHTIRGELTVQMPISLCVLRFLRLFAAISSCLGTFLAAYRAGSKGSNFSMHIREKRPEVAYQNHITQSYTSSWKLIYQYPKNHKNMENWPSAFCFPASSTISLALLEILVHLDPAAQISDLVALSLSVPLAFSIDHRVLGYTRGHPDL